MQRCSGDPRALLARHRLPRRSGAGCPSRRRRHGRAMPRRSSGPGPGPCGAVLLGQDGDVEREPRAQGDASSGQCRAIQPRWYQGTAVQGRETRLGWRWMSAWRGKKQGRGRRAPGQEAQHPPGSIPAEQHVPRQTLEPGSAFLSETTDRLWANLPPGFSGGGFPSPPPLLALLEKLSGLQEKIIYILCIKKESSSFIKCSFSTLICKTSHCGLGVMCRQEIRFNAR